MTVEQILPSLRGLPKETEWVEFKQNNPLTDEDVGDYLSALSNSAALCEREYGYLVWGVENETHRVVGTTVQLSQRKVGNEEFENWLSHGLSPRVDLLFVEGVFHDKRVVLIRVQAAFGNPVSFRGNEWIRVGSIRKRLKEHTGKEAELWRTLERRPFESGIAAADVDGDFVITTLDFPKFFELSKQPMPDNRAAILDKLTADRLVVALGGDRYDVTNLGAILFAKDLRQFGQLFRKALRIIRYNGNSRLEGIRERSEPRGYACVFEEALAFIADHVPRNEVLKDAIRTDAGMYPPIALREVVANALIHQDFGLSGTGPMVEIFDDRVEVSNPGLPMVDTLRFIDHSPRSRNEMLADLMRRLGLCEERGSGFDKVVAAIEFFQLPAPDIQTDATHTRVILFAHRPLARMEVRDRVRACYQHCCLQHVSGQTTTNGSVRKRFQIDESDYTVASKIIRETIDAQLVRAAHPGARKHARYVPFWA